MMCELIFVFFVNSFYLFLLGLINFNCENFIGFGVVVNVEVFFKEFNVFEEKGLKYVCEKIFISDCVYVNFIFYVVVDRVEEV